MAEREFGKAVMSDRFAKRADEFIERVRAAPLDPAEEYILSFHCSGASDQPLPPVLFHLERIAQVEWPNESAFAREFAALLRRDAIIATINSLVRNLPEGVIALRGQDPDNPDGIEAVVKYVSLEIVPPGSVPSHLAGRPDAPPLREDDKGGLRVGKSRVLLELVIQAHHDGDTPEAIEQRYPTLNRADVYSVIAFYQRYPADVEKYLANREQQARHLWKLIGVIE
jgi:uncharacterized protein (DUF433 family)